jgi:hypothetical protein
MQGFAKQPIFNSAKEDNNERKSLKIETTLASFRLDKASKTKLWFRLRKAE